jgi:hypothetical protein
MTLGKGVEVRDGWRWGVAECVSDCLNLQDGFGFCFILHYPILSGHRDMRPTQGGRLRHVPTENAQIRLRPFLNQIITLAYTQYPVSVPH